MKQKMAADYFNNSPYKLIDKGYFYKIYGSKIMKCEICFLLKIIIIYIIITTFSLLSVTFLFLFAGLCHMTN